MGRTGWGSGVVVSCVVCIVVAPFLLAQEGSARARQLLSDLERPADSRELLAIGDAAIEPIVEALARERESNTIRQVILIGVLGSLHSPNANRALLRLLNDADPRIRAAVSSILGRNHEVCAVPRLMRLLGDDGQSAVMSSSHPRSERPLTVGEAAAAALYAITGVRSDAKLKVFENWWDKLQNRPDCTSWN